MKTAKKQAPPAKGTAKRSKAAPGPTTAVKTASKGPPAGGWPMPKVPKHLDQATAEMRWAWAQQRDPEGREEVTYERILSRWQSCLDQDANLQLWKDVLAGKKPKSALKYASEGGEFRGLPASMTAHRVLFDGKQAGVRLAAQPVVKTRGRASYDGLKITAIVPVNPKKLGTGSFKKFALYKEGMTPAEFIAAGGTKADVKYDVEHGFIKLV